MCGTHISAPFRQERAHTEVGQHLLGGEHGIARPAVLFTVRVIRREGVDVGKRGPAAEVLKSVQKIVRAGEAADITDVGADRHADDIRKLRLVIRARNLNILEAVVNEARMPRFGLVALFDVFIRLEFAALDKARERPEVQLVVLGQHIGITENKLRSRFAVEGIFTEAGKVLTDVECPAVFRFPFLFCGEFLINADRLHFLCTENTAGALVDLDSFPIGVVVICVAPIAELETRVVKFAVTNGSKGDRTEGCLPGAVGDHRLHRTVLAIDLQLANDLGPVSPRRGRCVPCIHDEAVVEAVTERNADRVFTHAKLVGHVILHIVGFLVVTGIRGGEDIVARLFAVDEAFKITETADRQISLVEILFHEKFLTQILRGNGHLIGSDVGDPLRLPFFFKLARDERADGACLFAVNRFHVHGIEIALDGKELFSLVMDQNRVIVPGDTAVPDVSRSVCKRALAGIHADAAALLAVTAYVGGHLIRKTRQIIQTAGVLQIIDGQILYGNHKFVPFFKINLQFKYNIKASRFQEQVFLYPHTKKKFDFFLQMRYNKNNESKIPRDLQNKTRTRKGILL